jgi:hypothetical protein
MKGWVTLGNTQHDMGSWGGKHGVYFMRVTLFVFFLLSTSQCSFLSIYHSSTFRSLLWTAYNTRVEKLRFGKGTFSIAL